MVRRKKTKTAHSRCSPTARPAHRPGRRSRRGRMEIVYVYQRLRKDFGRAPKFTEMPCDTLFDIMPNPEMLG